MIGCMVITDGRKACLEQTIDSFFENNRQDRFRARLIVNDSMDVKYHEYLRETYGKKWFINSCALVAKSKCGFGGAIQAGWDWFKWPGFGTEWIFHLEEDFLHMRPIDTQDMVEVLRSDPDLTQVALVRDAVAPHEHAAGGLLQSRPGQFSQELCQVGPSWNPSKQIPWLSHQSFFTTNPCLYSVDLVRQYSWPLGENSEARFGEQLVAEGKHFGFMGRLDDEPWVKHIGHSRSKDWKA